jgi:hypothetical protein
MRGVEVNCSLQTDGALKSRIKRVPSRNNRLNNLSELAIVVGGVCVQIAVSFKLTAIEKLNLLRRFDISDALKEYSERSLIPPLLHKLILINKLSR